ncbi:MAG TPA: hypothetical protein VGB73_10845 [Pyrinomonadaceae bacterium]
MKWIIRVSAAFVSAAIFALSIREIALVMIWVVNKVSGISMPTLTDMLYELREQQTSFRALMFVSWLAVWLLCEVASRHRSSASRSRWVSHLRYAPLAIACFAAAFTLFNDGAGIQYSRWQITRYVYGDASPQAEMPPLELYNDHRGFCGNGYSAHEYWLYGDAAAAGFESADPQVRARALRATAMVYDWLNGSEDGPFIEILFKAESDPDPYVRQLAASYKAELWPKNASD